MTRTTSRIALGVAMLAIGACTSERTTPTVVRVPIFDRGGEGHDGDALSKIEAHLKGRNENPPNASQAQGEAEFRFNDDGTVDYKLIASNIDNPFMAHIHIAAAGVNGPIAVWLFPSTTPGVTGPLGIGRHDGILAEGTFTAANFVGPLLHQPMSALLAALQANHAYVNVHTNDGVAPVTNQPGDIPGGEIRAQLGPHGDDDH